MIDMIKNGGIIMIPILLCGVAATFIIIERIVYFVGLGKSNRNLMEKIVPMIRERDYVGASIECSATASPTSMVIGRALDSLDFSSDEFNRAVETESARQYPRLERFLTALGIISNVATLLGLLGTVTGNIKAFLLSGLCRRREKGLEERPCRKQKSVPSRADIRLPAKPALRGIPYPG